MKLQQKIPKQAQAAVVGRELVILAEGESSETELLWEGRTEFHAPEIDGKVYINDFGALETSKPASSIAPRSPKPTTTTWSPAGHLTSSTENRDTEEFRSKLLTPDTTDMKILCVLVPPW